MMTKYQLPNGDVVDIQEDVARGEPTVSFTMKGGEIVEATKVVWVDPAILLTVGTRVRHTVAKNMCGEIVGYGHVSWVGRHGAPQPVYLVKVDEPMELKTDDRTYGSVSVFCMNINWVHKLPALPEES
jgi:hypothetical protein